jgi:hypothetical protein
LSNSTTHAHGARKSPHRTIGSGLGTRALLFCAVGLLGGGCEESRETAGDVADTAISAIDVAPADADVALADAGGQPVPDGTGDAGASGPATIRLSGWAFAFAGGGKPLVARIGIAEIPGLETTSAPDGTWEIEVPNGVAVTPWAESEGYQTMHLQTFTGSGEPIDHVDFQMVEKAIFNMFAYVLEMEPDPGRCQISTTVNTIKVRDLPLSEFVAYGAHGVAGATSHAEPEIPDTVYFDETTIPDRSLTETTIDGGVVWANVLPGVYTLRAVHPTRFFAPFVATCEPGRFINAGPTRGLRELTAEEAASLD